MLETKCNAISSIVSCVTCEMLDFRLLCESVKPVIFELGNKANQMSATAKKVSIILSFPIWCSAAWEVKLLVCSPLSILHRVIQTYFLYLGSFVFDRSFSLFFLCFFFGSHYFENIIKMKSVPLFSFCWQSLSYSELQAGSGSDLLKAHSLWFFALLLSSWV